MIANISITSDLAELLGREGLRALSATHGGRAGAHRESPRRLACPTAPPTRSSPARDQRLVRPSLARAGRRIQRRPAAFRSASRGCPGMSGYVGFLCKTGMLCPWGRTDSLRRARSRLGWFSQTSSAARFTCATASPREAPEERASGGQRCPIINVQQFGGID